MSQKSIIYVYGTLRPGLGETVLVPGRIYDLGWFPGLLPGGDDFVICEKIEVDDHKLRELDAYEGYNEKSPESSLYIRERYDDGFIYVYNDSINGYPVVPGGDWLKYKPDNYRRRV